MAISIISNTSTKSFSLTNDATVYPEQLKLVQTWQPKRQFLILPGGFMVVKKNLMLQIKQL
jgi:hypothetical protein